MTPFFRVFTDGDSRNEIKTINSFSYEDSAKESSLLTLQLNPPDDYDLGEDPYLKKGVILYFNFGMAGGSISETHTARITDIKVSYGSTIAITIKALDKGNYMRKSSSIKIWKKKTTEDIIVDICHGWGLEVEIDVPKTGFRYWESIPQGSKSDMAFINYLLDREKSGNYLFYVRGNRAYVVQRSNDEKSVRTFTYTQGKGVVLSFDPVEKDSTQTGAGTKAEAISTDSYGNQVKATDDSEPKSGTKLFYDADANDITNKIKQEESKVGTPEQRKRAKEVIGKVASVAVSGLDEATSVATSKKLKENAEIMPAKLRVELDATLVPNEVINIDGVYKQHAGAWRIMKATHDINSSGGITTLDLQRASISNKSKGKKAKNSSSGKAEVQGGVINAYTANAESVAVDKKEFDRKIIRR